jgi:hypothetical protein
LEGVRVLRKLSAIVTAAAAGAAVLVAGGGPAMAGTASAALPSTCSGVLRVDSFVFNPAQVARGQSSAATLTATNCTGVTQTVSETWYGRFSSTTSTGIPPGCPVYDPLPLQATFAPHAQVTRATSYLTFAGCTADRLTITVSISQGGVQLAQRNAVLAIV